MSADVVQLGLINAGFDETELLKFKKLSFTPPPAPRLKYKFFKS
jgi:hypothetical protein